MKKITFHKHAKNDWKRQKFHFPNSVYTKLLNFHDFWNWNFNAQNGSKELILKDQNWKRNSYYNSGAAGACAGRPKVLGASAGEAGIETGDPSKKTATTTKVTPFFVTQKTPPTFGGKFHFWLFFDNFWTFSGHVN